MERAGHQGDRAAPMSGSEDDPRGNREWRATGAAADRHRRETRGCPYDSDCPRRSQDNRLSGDSPGGGVQAAEAEAGGVVLGVGISVGHDIPDDLEVPGAASAPQGGRGAGAAADHREAGDRIGLAGDHLVGVVPHGASVDVSEPLDLGLGVTGHVGQDAVIGQQGVDRLDVAGDHGIAQKRVEVGGRMGRDLGDVGVGTYLSLGVGEGGGLVGTVGAATHGSRVEPDAVQTRDEALSARLTSAQVPTHMRLHEVARNLHGGCTELPGTALNGSTTIATPGSPEPAQRSRPRPRPRRPRS